MTLTRRTRKCYGLAVTNYPNDRPRTSDRRLISPKRYSMVALGLEVARSHFRFAVSRIKEIAPSLDIEGLIRDNGRSIGLVFVDCPQRC